MLEVADPSADGFEQIHGKYSVTRFVEYYIFTQIGLLSVESRARKRGTRERCLADSSPILFLDSDETLPKNY